MRVTIITAVYNSASTLQATIECVRSQGYPDIEHIIIDGNSSDGSKKIAMSYINRNCRVISEEDRGYYDALNKGINLAEGDIIGILNADDVYPDKNLIKTIVNHFVDDAELDCVYGDLHYVDYKKGKQFVVTKWVGGNFSQRKIKYGWMPPHPTVFLRRSVYETIGDFDLRFRISSDYDYILRAFTAKNFKCKYMPNIMVHMLVGGLSNRSWRNIAIKMIEDYQIMKKNQLSPMVTLFLKNAFKLNQLRRFFHRQ